MRFRVPSQSLVWCAPLGLTAATLSVIGCSRSAPPAAAAHAAPAAAITTTAAPAWPASARATAPEIPRSPAAAPQATRITPAPRHAVPAPTLADDAGVLARAVSAPLRAADDQCARFQEQVATWVAATEDVRQAELPALVTAAVARRAALRCLITGDPERALARRIPWSMRRALPPTVTAQLEQRIAGRGELVLKASAMDPQPGTHLTTSEQACTSRLMARIDQRVFVATSAAPRHRAPSAAPCDCFGIAIDDQLALGASAARALEPDEPLAPGTMVLVGQHRVDAAHLDPRTIIVQQGAQYRAVPRGTTVTQAIAQADAEAALDHKAAMQSQPTWTTGGKRVLVVRVRFADQTAMPAQAAMIAVGAGLDQHWRQVSYGQTWIAAWDTPEVSLPATEAAYNAAEAAQGPAAGWTEAAYAAAKAANPAHDRALYDLFALRSAPSAANTNPSANIGTAGAWLIDDYLDNAVHEFGHNLGLDHANLWMCHSRIGSDGTGHFEYGDRYDLMGFGSADRQWWPYHAGKRRRLNWLPETAIAHVPVPAPTDDAVTTCTLFPADHPTVLGPTQPQALRCEPSGSITYLAEFLTGPWGTTTRPGVVTEASANPWVRHGLILHWDAAMPGWFDHDRLLDLHPGGAVWRDDAVLHLGETFADPQSHLFITPLHRRSGTPEAMDILVARGQFTGNQPPSLAVAADVAAPAVGQVVSWTATARDPDGHALAYAWDFGDDTFGMTDDNTATPQHTWTRAGVYQVVCTASDGRGGATTRQMTVRVGGATGTRLTGRVLRQSIGVAGVRVMAALTEAALADVTPAVAITDSDGRYVFPAQTPGTGYVMAAYADDAIITPQFSLPATTAAERDFVLTDLPVVAIHAADSMRAEGQSTILTLQRQGTTTRPLTVALTSLGSAAFTGTSDAELHLPDGSVAPWAYDAALQRLVTTVTIPAGQTAVECLLIMRSDTRAEPEKDVTVEVLDRRCAPATDDYRVAWPARATVRLSGTPAPANDRFAQAIALSGSAVSTRGSCAGATLEAGEPALLDPANGESVWWTWTAPSNGLTVFSTSATTADTVLTVAIGTTVDGLAVLGTDDDHGATRGTSRLLLPTTAGTTYRLRVASYLAGGNPPAFTLTITHTTAAPPTLAGLPTRMDTVAGLSVPPLPFTVADLVTQAADLQVSVASLTPALLANDANHCRIDGQGGTRTLALRTEAAARGTATVLVTARNAAGQTTTAEVSLVIRAPSTPFAGSPHPLPGTLQAEYYDEGGEGVGYHDVALRGAARRIRSNDAVGLRYRDTAGGGYDITDITDGEWLQYTVTVATSGRYRLDAALIAQLGGGGLRWWCDGLPLTSKLTLPRAVAPDQNATLTAPDIALSAGTHLLRVEFFGGGFAVDAFSFTLVSADPVVVTTPTPTPPPAPPTTPGGTTTPGGSATTPGGTSGSGQGGSGGGGGGGCGAGATTLGLLAVFALARSRRPHRPRP